ncbi:putative c6 transcription factor [Phaeomoniella chlamydospora]|uniref:Putative c6 transcription factor n=1 Tax=Phaeomoniella chlamydospora TaxID=158046 RepID=A0A0G2E697_PHACM|nr:putative c6 transcription factor [Phaeomoniella chlamydospora]
MAQDIGMHKLEGLRLEGRIGPTPKTAKRGSAGSSEESEREEEQKSLTQQEEEQLRKEMRSGGDQEIVTIEDRRANERERIDTFYAVFFLDRVVSSGTGRPVTLRDKDIEISFPFRSDDESIRGWPAPFPPLIRIIHLYGRAADVLNGIKEVQQVTSETLKKLAGLEKDLTGIYQGLSPKLHFNAVNFQHYVKAEQGTNFILLHFWFHTLIVLLHQPTLFHSFGGNIQELLQLFPDSRELSMSSAKTIADILAFAELIDAKSFIGNPFTTQPIYIAACAFLAEIAHYSSSPSSRDVTPPAQRGERTTSSRPDKRAAKYTLLTAAANQNYQQCYKALKSLENYWAGARYILTALDQKSKGIMDPLLYTVEDVESAIEVPRQYPAFSTPGWRQSIAHNHSLSYPNMAARGRHGSNGAKDPLSPTANPIGWSLTGTMNSPNPNLSVLYSAPYAEPLAAMDFSTSQVPDMSHHRPGGAFQASPQTSKRLLTHASAGIPNSNMPSQTRFPTKQHYHNERMSDADLPLSLNSPAATSTSLGSGPSPNPNNPLNFPPTSQFTSSPSLPNMPPPLHDPLNTNPSSSFNHLSLTPNINYPNSTTSHLFNDATVMTIQSQDIDVNAPQNGFAFPNGETIPWLEYLPEDILSYFNDPSSHDGQQDQQQGQMVNNQQGTGADGAGTT